MTTAAPADKKIDRRSTRWDAHRTKRREELLDLAHRAVRKYGPLVSMDQIAEVSQTSKSIIYRYFTDKHGLQTALSERMMKEIMARFEDASKDVTGVDEIVGKAIDVLIGFADEEPGLYVFARIPELEGEPGAESILNFDFVAEALINEHGDVEGADRLRAIFGYQRGFSRGIVSFIGGITDSWMASREFVRNAERFAGQTIDVPAYELGMFSREEISALIRAMVIPSIHAMMRDSLELLRDLQPQLARFEHGDLPAFVAT